MQTVKTDVEIRLPEETVNYLQRLDYELGGLQVLHTHALNAGTPLEKRMEIRREYQERYAEYQLAKQEMWAEFDAQYPNCSSRRDARQFQNTYSWLYPEKKC